MSEAKSTKPIRSDALTALNQNTPPGIMTLEGEEVGGTLMIAAIGSRKVAVVMNYDPVYDVHPLGILQLRKKTRCWGRHFTVSSVDLKSELPASTLGSEGTMRTVAGGGLEVACVDIHDALVWVRVPCSTDVPAGLMFSAWMLVVNADDNESDYAVCWCQDGEMARCWVPLKKNWSSLRG